MLDFKQIMAMKEEIGTLSSKRHKESDISHLKGMELLEKAHETGLRDRQLLMQASDAFMQAIQHNRRNPDPYVGVAYLLLLLDDRNKAIKYLNEARRVQPSHEKAELLLRSILEQEEAQKSEIASSTETDSPGQDILEGDIDITALPVLSRDRDYDLLYDQIETLILEQSRALMEANLGLVPTFDLTELEPLKVKYRNLRTIYRHIDRQVNVIDREIDVSELRQKMHPIETMLKRMENVRNASRHMVDVRDTCESNIAQAEALYNELTQISQASVLHTAEAKLETLLDACDRIADLLDGISETGFSIESVEGYYNNLVSKVEACQDLVDDLAEHLN